MAIKEILYNNNKFRISYKLVNNKANKNMIFLHGWGSNKEIMAMAFQKYFKDYNHIYIDLPGFGASINEHILKTKDYANIVDIFLHNLNTMDKNQHLIVVGHSFGGKIALLLKYEIILLSSAGILLPKPLKVRLKIIIAKISKFLPFKINLLRADDAKNLNSVMYNIFKNVVDEDFSMQYKTFNYKATIFWGANDNATPLKSYYIICDLMPNAKSHILQGDHYFFLKQGETIERLYYDK